MTTTPTTMSIAVLKEKDPMPRRSDNTNSNTTSGLPIDLATLDDEELALLTVEAPRELERRKAKREVELLAFIREQVTVLGVPMARLRAALGGNAAASSRTKRGDAGDRRSVVAPKYRHPETGETWSGRGASPPWVEFGDEINLKTGKPLPLAKFRIPEDEE
jgi:DNA-binding protein H-NS